VAFRPTDERTAYAHPQHGAADLQHSSFGAVYEDKLGDGSPEQPEACNVPDPATKGAALEQPQAPISDPKCDAPADPVAPQPSGVEREKARLQDLVKAFVKRAVKGITCSMVRADGATRPATYYVDRRLRELTVKAAEQGDLPALDSTFPIGSVTVLQNQAALRALPSTASAQLSDMVSTLLAIVVDDQSVFLAEGSNEDADNFAVCMRVLRVYCRQQTST